MKQKLFLGCLLLALAMLSIVPALAQDEFVFGLILVGPQTDGGWSQAHYEAGQFVEEHIPGARMIVLEDLFSNPGATVMSVASDMIAEGAQLIFTTSDAFQEDTDPVAEAFPDVTFINISGDHVLNGDAPANLGNLMGQMEWGKLIGGCAAGLATEAGNIGYLGPIIIPETRRLASSAYLGAKYCYEHYRGENPDDLVFTIQWINGWVPNQFGALDGVETTDFLFDNGADVVISGIDTLDAIKTASTRAQEGEHVFAVPYDHHDACDNGGPEVCLGVPYFNWGPSYVKIVQAVMDGTWEQSWDWVGPDWSDINNMETSAVGFVKGAALTEEQSAQLDEFIADLAAYATNPFVPNSFALWTGPLNFQDGTEFAADRELVHPLDVWYLPQLLEGINGASS